MEGERDGIKLSMSARSDLLMALTTSSQASSWEIPSSFEDLFLPLSPLGGAAALRDFKNMRVGLYEMDGMV